MKTFSLYLYSNKNLVGSLLALLGLAAWGLGFIGTFALPIVVGLYAFGVLVTPRTRYELQLEQGQTDEQIRAQLKVLLQKTKKRLPEELQRKAQSISDKIVELLPLLHTFEHGGNREAFNVTQTALDYLPSTLENYLNLPTAYARLHVGADGKTPQQMLGNQLELLEGSLGETERLLLEGDVQKMQVNGRFLEDKFGTPEKFL